MLATGSSSSSGVGGLSGASDSVSAFISLACRFDCAKFMLRGHPSARHTSLDEDPCGALMLGKLGLGTTTHCLSNHEQAP